MYGSITSVCVCVCARVCACMSCVNVIPSFECPGLSLRSIPLASLPPLEWPMPNHTEHYELHIDVQPKPHHRAHYETEGSRGAVKAPTGGHPVVQVRTP